MANLVTTIQAARVLNLSVEHVRTLADKGTLPVAMKIGARAGAQTRLFRLEDVQRLKAVREKARKEEPR